MIKKPDSKIITKKKLAKTYSKLNSTKTSNSNDEVQNEFDNDIESEMFLPSATSQSINTIPAIKSSSNEFEQVDALKNYIKTIGQYRLLTPEE
jgi:hypothetical protein